MFDYQQACLYAEKGLLSHKVDYTGRYHLFCYTPETFFEGKWDPVTKTHRGRLYHQGRPINYPFDKIFNLNEVEETSQSNVLNRMNYQEFNVFDKANGHLFIVTVAPYQNELIYTTKGSFPGGHNPLLENDIEIFKNKHEDRLLELDLTPGTTLMFEAIVQHDPHTLYESQVEKYGQDSFVLLGINGFDSITGDYFMYNLIELEDISHYIGCSLIEKRDDIKHDLSNIDELKDDKGVEGYVFQFLDGYRVKIKTKEYWALRFKKELQPSRLVDMFCTAGPDRLYRKLPEEIVDEIQDLILKHFFDWLYIDRLKAHELDESEFVPDRSFKELFTQCNHLTKDQKNFIVSCVTNKDQGLTFFHNATRSKRFRRLFQEELNNDRGPYCSMENQIQGIVDKL